ncbi:hypothetical protein HAX54_027684, partial [Datura stramonium]|nr:hypothetical protein [Datura stramonium]
AHTSAARLRVMVARQGSEPREVLQPEKLQQHNIDYPLSEHSRALAIWSRYEEPLDDDMAIMRTRWRE